MATPLLLRSRPTCLSCLRQTLTANSTSITGVLNGSRAAAAAPATTVLAQQVRGKKRGRPRDQGVVVRLLEDAPTYGRRGALFLTERGRMRNILYPRAMAEYMTAARFAELGLSADDVGQRDFHFGVAGAPVPDEPQQQQQARQTAPLEVPSLLPERVAELLQRLLPPVLSFNRKPIAPAQQKHARSPLFVEDPAIANAPVAVFGSVSPEDVALRIRELLHSSSGVEGAEARLIRVEARDVRSLQDGPDNKIKTLGRFEAEIAVVRSDAAGTAPEPIRRVVEVVAEGGD